MEAIRESKEPHAGDFNPLLTQAGKPSGQKSETDGEINLFQELSRRKLNEPPCRKTTSTEASDNDTHRSSPNWIHVLIAACVFAAACILFVASLESGNKEVSIMSKPEPVHAVAESMQTKYNARPWDSAIPASRRANPFSIEISDAFLQEPSRPVLVHCTLVDISHGNENIEAVFALPNSRPGNQNLLVLKCWNDQLELFAEGIRGVSEYAVVANCYEARNAPNTFSIIGGLIDASILPTVERPQRIEGNH